MSNFNSNQLHEIRAEINEALRKVAENHNVSFDLGNIRYDDTSFRCELKANMVSKDGGRIVSKNEINGAIREARLVGLEYKGKSPIGNRYSQKGQICEVVGFNSGSPTNCWKVEVKGKSYKCPSGYLHSSKLI